MEYTIPSRKTLVSKIANLSTIEHVEIFKILQKNNVQFSQNRNGFFFNISTIEDKVIREMIELVDFYEKNKVELEEIDKKIIDYHVINKNNKKVEDDKVEEDIYDNVKEDWSGLLDKKTITKIQHSLDDIINNRTKKVKNEFDDKYVNSLKKYTYYFNNNKKIDCDTICDLSKEKYIIEQ